MDQMELVESLREKTGCGYSEAKAALEETGGDLLEALCWLEQHGKTQVIGASCSTEDHEPPRAEPEPEATSDSGPFVRGVKTLWGGIQDLIRLGNSNELVVQNKAGKKELGVPLTLLVLLLIAAFWFVIALIILALFCGWRFSIEGPVGSPDLNETMGKATDFAENIKDEVFSKDDT